MTLILGMSKDEGVYLSVDYRVTNLETGKVVDDLTVKFLTVMYPPDQIGPNALLAYTGLAYARDGTPIGGWMHVTLRGESEHFDASMAHVRSRLDRDIAPMGVGLIINALVVHGEKRYIGGLSNIEGSKLSPVWKVRDSFGYSMNELSDLMAVANGSGAQATVTGGHLDAMSRQLTIRPRRIEDHMNLLATINKRVAAVELTVSPHCHVAFLNADGRYDPVARNYAEGQTLPLTMRTLLFGIDLSVISEPLFHQFAEDGRVSEIDRDKVNRKLQRRPDGAVRRRMTA